MVTWIHNDWGSYFSNPPTPGSDGKLLIVDIHRGQQTPKVKNYLRRCKTKLVNIPGGLTVYAQLLDMVVNKHFKAYVQRLSEKHMEENLQDYVGGKVSTLEKHILITKWCDEAWKSISRSSVVRGFKKCGLSTNVDGSKNQEVHSEKTPDYQMPLDNDELSKEYTLCEDVESNDGDGEDYVESVSGTEENADSELSSDACSDN